MFYKSDSLVYKPYKKVVGGVVKSFSYKAQESNKCCDVIVKEPEELVNYGIVTTMAVAAVTCSGEEHRGTKAVSIYKLVGDV